MDGGFDEGGDAADGVEGDGGVDVLEAALGGGVGAPGEVGAVGAVLFVACDCFFCQGGFGGEGGERAVSTETEFRGAKVGISFKGNGNNIPSARMTFLSKRDRRRRPRQDSCQEL